MFIYLSYEDQVRAHNYALGVVNERKNTLIAVMKVTSSEH